MGIIVILLFVVGIPTVVILFILSEKKKENEMYSLFKPGMILEYYHSENHGKFQEWHLTLKYEILDRDGRYVWAKRIEGDVEYETEIDLYIDCRYVDKMVLKDAEGNIIRTFKFQL